ncbi:MAG: nucleoside phosphorylase, partial [Chloroflexi bacterium]|nr:nucleoside phosphorylase [Chloroflexota bacterium]
MTSIFTHPIWSEHDRYVTPQADFAHHGFDPTRFDMGTACLVTFSSSLFNRVLARVTVIEEEEFQWPYQSTPLKICATPNGTRFGLHFPSYGGTRIANSLEQLAACGYRYVFGLGLGGALQEDVHIGDMVVLEGAVRGDGVSRYYAPVEYPAIADAECAWSLAQVLREKGERFHVGISFGIDALYRETEGLIASLRELGVLTIDLESSAFLTVGRRLGLRCCWAGVVSDRLVGATHEGNIHA